MAMMEVDSQINIEQLTGCSEQQRFIIELEFVQALSNPHYLNWLAQNKYFEDEAFQAYIKYLSDYWRKPEYAKYLQYPHCLFFLEQLQDADFCKALINPHTAEFIHTQQYWFWQHFWNGRVKEGMEADNNNHVVTEATSAKPKPFEAASRP